MIEAGSIWRRRRDGVLVEVTHTSLSLHCGTPCIVGFRLAGGARRSLRGRRFLYEFEPATVRDLPQHRVDDAREEHGAIASDRAGSGDLGLDGAGGGDGDSAGHVPTVGTTEGGVES